MLRGVQGLFRASDLVDADAFRSYVEALPQGVDFAGIHALAFAPFEASSLMADASLPRRSPASRLPRA